MVPELVEGLAHWRCICISVLNPLLLINQGTWIYDVWERLVAQYQVSGVNDHDARLTAAMVVHGITHILTFNIEDFNRYAGEITPVHPTAVGR
jgi:hypothetical protein